MATSQASDGPDAPIAQANAVPIAAAKGHNYSSRSISPLISSERPIPPSVTVASAGSLSFPLSLPSAKPWRTAFSISRWAVTPNLLRNLRMLVLKTSSFIVASMLQLAAGLQQHSNEAPYLAALALYNNRYH